MISLISDNLFDFFKILLKQSKFLTCITMEKNSQKGFTTNGSCSVYLFIIGEMQTGNSSSQFFNKTEVLKLSKLSWKYHSSILLILKLQVQSKKAFSRMKANLYRGFPLNFHGSYSEKISGASLISV